MFGKLFCKSAFEKKASIIVFDKLLCKTDVKKNRFFKAGFCSFLFLAFFTQNCEKKLKLNVYQTQKSSQLFLIPVFFRITSVPNQGLTFFCALLWFCLLLFTEISVIWVGVSDLDFIVQFLFLGLFR